MYVVSFRYERQFHTNCSNKLPKCVLKTFLLKITAMFLGDRCFDQLSPCQSILFACIFVTNWMAGEQHSVMALKNIILSYITVSRNAVAVHLIMV